MIVPNENSPGELHSNQVISNHVKDLRYLRSSMLSPLRNILSTFEMALSVSISRRKSGLSNCIAFPSPLALPMQPQIPLFCILLFLLGREVILAPHLSYKEYTQRKLFLSCRYTNLLKAGHH